LTPLVYPEGLDEIAESGVFTVFEPPRAVAHGRLMKVSDAG
jgi:hypothetical protein